MKNLSGFHMEELKELRSSLLRSQDLYKKVKEEVWEEIRDISLGVIVERHHTYFKSFC